MSNAIFPSLPGLTWNITRAPMFSTKVQQAVGGRRIAAAFQAYPIYRYTLEYEFLRTYAAYVEWQTLAGFFEARQGSFDSFLYSDPEDNTILPATPQLIGAGDGSNKDFQLGRTLGSQFFSPIYNVDARVAAPIIYLSGAPVAGYSISATGLVTFVTAPGASVPVAWSGQYYWRACFENDATEFQMFAQHFWAARAVSFLTVLGA